MKYRSEIDGLRAVAVIPVIFFHAGFELFSGGFVGVDVFFVLSGYLITSIIISELDKDKFSIINFYERRARRILPALFFVIFVCLILAYFILLPTAAEAFGKSIIATILFSSNILYWSESGYFDAASELKPLIHTWSLAVEEQFYILFPLLLIFIHKLRKRWALFLITIFFILSISLAHYGAYHHPIAAFYLLPTRGWELLIGGAAAFILYKNINFSDKKPLLIRNILSLTGLIFILFSIFIYNNKTPFPSLFALLPTVGTFLVILFATKKTLVNHLLSNKILVSIGLVSYSAYLWHQPLLAFARYTNKNISISALIILCGVSFILAYFSYKFIETPFRKANFISRKSIFLLSLAGMLSLSSIGMLIYYTNGYASRFKQVHQYIGHEEYYAYLEKNFFPCSSKIINSHSDVYNGVIRCRQSKSDSPSLVLFGDSHAEHLFMGVAKTLKDTSIAYYIRGGESFAGEKRFNYIIDEINSNQKVKTVVYVVDWGGKAKYIEEEILYDKILKTVRRFKEFKKNVVLVFDTPEFNMSAADCIYEKTNYKYNPECSLSMKEYLEQEKSYRHLLEKVSDITGTELIKLTDYFCKNDQCSLFDSSNNLLFRDGGHLNILGSINLGKELVVRSKILSSIK